MNSFRFSFGLARFPSIASDPEAQRQHASFEDRRTIINFSKPPPLRPCARGTISALPFDSTPTRNVVNTYFALSSPTFSRGTIYSRHDRPPPPSRLPFPDNIPPPYEYPLLANQDKEARLPSYSEHIGPCDDDKPFLLAKFLFKYGFVFPPLWFLSILILIIPLTPPTCEFDKASGERAVLLCHTRVAERMWAHRSLCAAGVFSGLVTFIAAAFVVITHAA